MHLVFSWSYGVNRKRKRLDVLVINRFFVFAVFPSFFFPCAQYERELQELQRKISNLQASYAGEGYFIINFSLFNRSFFREIFYSWGHLLLK